MIVTLWSCSVNRLEYLGHVAKRMKLNICNRQDSVLKEARNDKKAEVSHLIKERQMNKHEVSKSMGKKYVATLEASKIRKLKGESTKSLLEYIIFQLLCAHRLLPTIV